MNQDKASGWSGRITGAGGNVQPRAHWNLEREEEERGRVDGIA